MFDSRLIWSIGMVNVTAKHTGANLANIIRERLATVGVSTAQVIAITTDNGTNMKSMIDCLNDDAEKIDDTAADNNANTRAESKDKNPELESTEFVFLTTRDYEEEIRQFVKNLEINNLIIDNPISTIESDDESNSEDDQPNIDSLLEEITRIIDPKSWLILSIRCGAHTLQLAIMYALKSGDFGFLITLCREVCKELRKSGTRIELSEKGIPFKMPRIDVVYFNRNVLFSLIFHVLRIFYDLKVADLIVNCLEAIK